jgi:ketosteroid isomerase-like protein
VYHAVVRRKVTKVFEAISAGDTTAMLDTLAPKFTYRFAGDGALSGVRTTRAEVATWWTRVFALFPGAQFGVREVLVDGWPRRTRVATHVVLDARTATGHPYRNEFVQIMELRWGRATRVLTLEDTARLAEALDEMSGAGVAEAGAVPIGARMSLDAI